MSISKLKYERTMLVITLICETAAYLLALLFRYVILTSFYSNADRFYSFYRVFMGVVLAVRVMLFYYFIRNDEREPIWKQETVEIIASSIKQHLILLVILALFLYFARLSTLVSRTVMGFLILFGIILDVAARKLYIRYYNSHYQNLEKKTSVILIAEEGEQNYLSHAIKNYGFHNREKDFALDCEVTRCFTPEEINGKDEFNVSEDGTIIYLSVGAKHVLTENGRALIQKSNCPIMRELEHDGESIIAGRTAEAGNHTVLFDSQMSRTCDVLGVRYNVSTISEAVAHIKEHVSELSGQYICFSNVHTTVTAYEDPEYRRVLNGAVYTFPDGKPVAKRIAGSGFPEAERIAGPDFMDRMFFATANSEITHYFFGSTEETLKHLKTNLEQRYPCIKIVGLVSPPFRELTPEEDEKAIKAINESGASMIWIGLGAPKQEKWMAAHQGKVNGVMLGVGAGFDFHAGTVKRAPVLIQKLGMEWLYRLLQNPGRLFKRYFVTNSKFIWYTRKPAE